MYKLFSFFVSELKGLIKKVIQQSRFNQKEKENCVTKE